MAKKIVRLGAIILIMGLLLITVCKVQIVYANDLILKVDKIVKEYDTIYEGDPQILDILIKGREKVQYRVWLNNKNTGEWKDITNGFTSVVDSNRVYSITTPKLTEGDYNVSVWVKRAGKIPQDKRGFDTYSTIDFSCLKNEGQASNISIGELKNNYAIGEMLQIKKDENKQYLYKYKVINAINNKELVSYKNYIDSVSWKAASQGVYLMQIDIKYIEKVEVPKQTQEDTEINKINTDSEEKDETLNVEDNPDDKDDDITSDSNYELNEDNNNSVIDEPKKEIEYKEIEKKVTITKLIMVGDPFKYVGPALPSNPSINSLVVGNVGEGQIIYIKTQPSSNSKNVGYIYGSLQGVKILKQVDKFYYIEARDYDSLKIVKGYVYKWQLKTVKPSGAYSLVVDLSDQRVYVFKYKKLFKTIICSTGQDWTPTPTGTYLVGYRGTHFYTGYKNSVICYNWVRFNNDFLFHSVLFNTKGEIIQSEAKKLGSKASHGCIRLPLKNAKWIYNNIPRGSLVVVQN